MNKERISLIMGNSDCETTQAVKDKRNEKEKETLLNIMMCKTYSSYVKSLQLSPYVKIKTSYPSSISYIIQRLK